jgi:hypothetical protein
LRARSGIPTEERTARYARLGSGSGSAAPDAYPVGEAFRVDPAEELDRHIDVSIGSSSDDWGRKILSRYHPQRIPAPAKSYPNIRLPVETELVDLYAHPENYVSFAIAGAADSKGRTVRSRTRSRISARCRITPEPCRRRRIIGKQRRTRRSIGACSYVLPTGWCRREKCQNAGTQRGFDFCR